MWKENKISVRIVRPVSQRANGKYCSITLVSTRACIGFFNVVTNPWEKPFKRREGSRGLWLWTWGQTGVIGAYGRGHGLPFVARKDMILTSEELESWLSRESACHTSVTTQQCHPNSKTDFVPTVATLECRQINPWSFWPANLADLVSSKWGPRPYIRK